MIKNAYKRIRSLLPDYSWVCFLFLAAFQVLVFWVTRIPLKYMDKLDLSIPLDGIIPFQPAWITIYVLSFASWFKSVRPFGRLRGRTHPAAVKKQQEPRRRLGDTRLLGARGCLLPRPKIIQFFQFIFRLGSKIYLW